MANTTNNNPAIEAYVHIFADTNSILSLIPYYFDLLVDSFFNTVIILNVSAFEGSLLHPFYD